MHSVAYLQIAQKLREVEQPGKMDEPVRSHDAHHGGQVPESLKNWQVRNGMHVGSTGH